MVLAFFLGACLGFIGSIPVAGPIAAMVLARSMQGRITAARRIAWGAAIAESVYAFFAFFGFSEWLSRYVWLGPISKGVAAIIMFVLTGVVLYKRAKGRKSVAAKVAQLAAGTSISDTSSGGGHVVASKTNDEEVRAAAHSPPGPPPNPVLTREPFYRNLLLGFSVTIVNPTLLATWTAVVTTVYSLDWLQFSLATAIVFAMGTLTGIIGWSFAFTALAQGVRSIVSPKFISRLVVPFALFLGALGTWLGVQAIREAVRVF